jgi:sialidase-1
VDRERGRIHKFYRVLPVMPDHRESFRAMRDDAQRWIEWGAGNFVVHSDDEGRTWSQPRRLDISHPDASQPGYLTNGVHGIQLGDGVLVVGGCCHCGEDFEYNSDMDTRSFLLVSGDGGASWERGATWQPGYACKEFAMAATGDGRIYVNQRSLGPHRRVLWIDDVREDPGSLREDPQLPEPVCHAGLHRSGQRLYFVNPCIPNHERRYRQETRRDLTLRLSRDDGVTWQKARQLFDGPSGYADLTDLPGGGIGCLYECGEDRYDDRIDFAVVPEQKGSRPVG